MGASRRRLPDFIIGGAMKSGTTSLHRTLALHPQVYLPPSEVFFFDLDDFGQNADHLPLGRAQRPMVPDFDRLREGYLDWYASLFEPARDEQVVGEDSTTYLASEVAPGRIRALLPDVRLVFLLRDPVERAYSHYWHLVRTGRAVFSFEDSLRLAPETMLERGRYLRHFERWLDVFPREQLLVLLFEDFVDDPSPAVEATCRFIGVEPFGELPADALHENKGGPLVSHRANLLFNAVVGHRIDRHGGREPQPRAVTVVPGRPRDRSRVRAAAKAVSTRLTRGYPPMAEATRRVLREVYARENEGLSKVVGVDVERRWPYMG